MSHSCFRGVNCTVRNTYCKITGLPFGGFLKVYSNSIWLRMSYCQSHGRTKLYWTKIWVVLLKRSSDLLFGWNGEILFHRWAHRRVSPLLSVMIYNSNLPKRQLVCVHSFPHGKKTCWPLMRKKSFFWGVVENLIYFCIFSEKAIAPHMYFYWSAEKHLCQSSLFPNVR